MCFLVKITSMLTDNSAANRIPHSKKKTFTQQQATNMLYVKKNNAKNNVIHCGAKNIIQNSLINLLHA